MSSSIERLRIAHHLALRAQHSSQFDAAALVRAWPAVARNAVTAQAVLGVVVADRDRVVPRIGLGAESLAKVLGGRTWPGAGTADNALTQVSVALAAVTRNPAGPIRAEDLVHANRLLASILWSTARMVGRSCRDHSFDSRLPDALLGPDHLKVAATSRDFHRRFNAIEQLAGGALNGSGRGEQPLPSKGLALRRSVADWDVEAHRALLGNQSTAVLHVLSHLQAESVKAIQSFVGHSVEAGIIDHVTAGRLTPILQQSSMSWERLRDESKDLAFSSLPVPMRFIEAARNLQDAFADAAHGAESIEHPDILRAVSGHLKSSVTIAASARDLLDAGELRAPARAISRLLSEQGHGLGSPDKAPVDPVAIHRGATLPLDANLRRILDAPAEQVFRDAHEAVKRAAGLDSLYRSSTPPNELKKLDPSTGTTAPRGAGSPAKPLGSAPSPGR